MNSTNPDETAHPDRPATPAAADGPAPAAGKPWIKILAAVGILGAIIAAFVFFPVGELIQSAVGWVESLGVWAPIAFIAIYVLCAVLFIPGSVLTAGAGTIFGVVWGAIYVSVASTLGATLAFLIGRYLARGWIEKKIAGNQKFSAIDDAVGKEGWKIVGLTRLSPAFPFNLLNYAYGLTRVKLGHYVLASWIGMMPGTLLYVYIGSLGKAASEAGSKTPVEWTMYGVGFVATLAVTVYITKIARRALNKKINQ